MKMLNAGLYSRSTPEVLAFLEKAYALDGDKKTVDFCLEAMWEDMTERGEI